MCAGLTETWSNGPVEVFVDKLNLVKRQDYGEAGFGPLRAWVQAEDAPLHRVCGRARTS